MRTIESESTGQKFHGMTVKDLREAMRSLHPDTLVVGTWELQHVPVMTATVLRVPPGFPECLVLDVDKDTHDQKIAAIESDYP